MDEWVTKNVESMHFVFAALEDIELHCTYMVDRFASIQTVPDTRSDHHFIALNANKFKMSRLSGDDCSTVVNVLPEVEVKAITCNSINDLHQGPFVAVV